MHALDPTIGPGARHDDLLQQIRVLEELLTALGAGACVVMCAAGRLALITSRAAELLSPTPLRTAVAAHCHRIQRAARRGRPLSSLQRRFSAGDAVVHATFFLLPADHLGPRVAVHLREVEAASRPPATALTPAETEVLAGLCDGLSNLQIAKRRYRSLETVRSQVRSIFAKLGVHTRAEAMTLVLEHPELSLSVATQHHPALALPSVERAGRRGEAAAAHVGRRP